MICRANQWTGFYMIDLRQELIVRFTAAAIKFGT